MRPIDATLFVESTVTMERADEIMQRNGIGSVAIVDHAGQLVGFLQRGRLKKEKARKS